MAKIKVLGNALAVISAVKFEDMLTLQKYRPSALTLYGGDDGETPVFVVEAKSGAKGSIGTYGMTFGAADHSANGFATITLCLDVPANTDVAAYIADKYGAAVTNLNKIEAGVKDALEAVQAERKAIMDTITVE